MQQNDYKFGFIATTQVNWFFVHVFF